MLQELDVSETDLRENRYNHVVHLVTAASGAEAFYSLDNNAARTENLHMAQIRDRQAMKVSEYVYMCTVYVVCSYSNSASWLP